MNNALSDVIVVDMDTFQRTHYTPNEVGEQMQLDLRQVQRLCKNKVIRGVKLAGTWRINIDYQDYLPTNYQSHLPTTSIGEDQ